MTNPFRWISSVGITLGVLALAPRVSGASTLPLVVPSVTWPMYQYASDHNAVFDAPGWDVSWTASVGGEIRGGLSIVRATLFAESFDQKTYAFDALTGRKLWERALPDTVMTDPIVADGLVIVGGGTGIEMLGSMTQNLWGRGKDSVYGLDARTGDIVWQFDTVGENMATGVEVTVANQDEFVFCNGDDHAYALDTRSGKLLWEHPILGACLMSNFALDNGVIYGSSGFSWELISALATKHQLRAAERTLWTWTMRPSDGSFTWTSSPGSVHSSPTIGDGMVLSEFAEPSSWRNPNARITPDDDKVRLNIVSGFDQRTGALRWQYVSDTGPTTTEGSRVTELGGLYYRGAFYQALPLPAQFAAFQARTGKLLWKIQTSGPVKMSAIAQNGMLYFGDTNGKFYVVDATDGAIVQTQKFSGPFTISPPIIVGKTLFVTNGTAVYAIRLDGRLIRPSSE